MPEARTGRAPAKINLVLEVLGRRADGYHEIDTVLQTLELSDGVSIRPGPPVVEVTGPFAEGTPRDATNLALRALVALRERGANVPEMTVTLDKRIPPAGGLGGGASDAATVLRLVQALTGCGDEVLIAAANAVGSDEAALVLGGTVRARGRGDAVEVLPDIEDHGVVLFVPGATIDGKTGRMFGALAGTSFDNGAVAERFAATRSAKLTGLDIYNAFERMAFDVFEGLWRLHEELELRTGEPVRLAGAGPTLFWIGHEDEADTVTARAGDADCRVIRTRTARSLWRQ
ncbi:MAG: 4-(cytidine 5'-diphospho)-2-C-methyl-D-erythritol kinase [Tepidiformaceae bacterium]